MFYRYRQNNSGGEYVGPKAVIVEADTPSEADIRATASGFIYLDETYKIDCECCGHRWYPAFDPAVLGEADGHEWFNTLDEATAYCDRYHEDYKIILKK